MLRVLAHARESGIAFVFRTLLARLGSQGCDIFMDFNEYAQQAYGLNTQLLRNINDIDLIICGYDFPELDSTSEILSIAREKKIPTLAILDSWKGTSRFWYPNGAMRPMADITCVVDPIIFEHLISLGIPRNVLRVVQHPFLEQFKLLTRKHRNLVSVKAKKSLGLNHEKPILIFVSEPLISNNLNTNRWRSLAKCATRNQTQLLSDWVRQKYGEKYQCVMRTHPLEDIILDSGWVSGNSLPLEDSLLMADKVVGIGATPIIFSAVTGISVENLCDVIDWEPSQSNYDTKVWDSMVMQGRLGVKLNQDVCAQSVQNLFLAPGIVELINDSWGLSD